MYRCKTLFILLAIGLITQCRKPSPCMDINNPECSNYDPCRGLKEANADFGFFDRRLSAYGDTIYYLEMTDTIYVVSGGSNKVYFKAQSGMENYSWKIGQDPREFTDSLFYLDFDPVPGEIEVTLTVTHNTDLDCFPDGKIVDTRTKRFYIKPFIRLDELPAIGFFKGYDTDSPELIYTIEVIGDGVIGIPPDCDRIYGIPALVSQQAFVFDDAEFYQCHRPVGGGKRNHDDPELVIDYEVTNESGRRIKKQFRGVKQ